jgi:hypothetical protein
MAEPTALLSDFTTSPTMQSFHCDTVELRIQFEAGEMDIDAFLSAVDEIGVPTESDKDGDREIILILANEGAAKEYHAHLTVRIWKNRSGRAEIGYYTGGTESALNGPPSAENIAQWLGRFFVSEMTAHVHMNYTFNKSFKPTMSLNFPLTTTEKGLAGAVVSGLALIFPLSYPDTTAIIQSGEDNDTYIFLRKTVKASLMNFHLTEELENTSALVNNLIKRGEQ